MNPEYSLLGKSTEYADRYAPELLFPISRQPARDRMGIGSALPFFGVDIWNAYEFSWLSVNGKPCIVIATFSVPADSPNLIESKSLKLYLGSFSNTRYESAEQVRDIVERDLAQVSGSVVSVHFTDRAEFHKLKSREFDGYLLDELEIETDAYLPDASLLKARHGEAHVEEVVYSDLLKSNCPVTKQPDWASIQIHYAGAPIDYAALLRYIVSYRDHTAFHEQSVEQIFVDIEKRCLPDRLTVYARYTRRGGLDINPFRSNFDLAIPYNFRTARQ